MPLPTRKRAHVLLVGPGATQEFINATPMDLRDDDTTLEKLLGHSPDLICSIDAAGNFRHVGAASQRMLGYRNSAMVDKPFAHFVHPDDLPGALERCLAAYAQAAPTVFESRCLRKTGEEVVVEWSASRPPAEALMLCIGRDVTAQRIEQQRINAQNEWYRTVATHGFDLVALLSEDRRYTYVGGTKVRVLGYQSEELVGQSAFDFIHPEDLAAVQASWAELDAQPNVKLADFRFRAANGEWRWLEACVSNQLLNPALRGYTMSSRDVTKRKHSSFDLAKSEQRFRLLFENNPTLAVFQDIDGLVLNINPAFLAFLKQTKQEVVNRQLHAFLPPEVRALFQDKFRAAIGGQKVHFEVSVQGEGGEQRLKVNKMPLVVEGQIIGVHVAAEDITEMATAQDRIQQQAEELTTTLESITDAFLSLDNNLNLNYINQEAERLMNISREVALGVNLWTLFPEEVDGPCRRHYQQAIDTGQTVRFEMYFKRENHWFEVKAYPSAAGLYVYFSDISERVETEKQLRLLALVARSTDNGVVITDAAGRTEWVNDAFTRHTGYALAEVLDQRLDALLPGPDTDPATVRHVRERLKRWKPFSVTILNYKKSGEPLWLAMDITPVRNEAGAVTHFVALLQNINYRKEVEASQAKMTQDLYRHNRDLQQFTYVISHNLRAPLANALGLATLLTKVDKASAVFDATLGHLRHSMAQADAVLKDLNLVLSIRDKEHTGQQESVSLLEVCAQAVRNLDEPLQQCGGRVALAVDEGLAVHGDHAYLYSIFYNLLSNAIKYRAEARPLRVDIACTRAPGGGARISFADNGSGFDVFKAGSDVFQLYKRFHTNQRGRGIGLFLVKTHVEALGGKIEVASEVDFGTRFTIQLDQH